MAVARYVAKNAGRIGIDPRRIAIGGDSAGANLAIAAAIQLRDDGDRDLLRAMVLNYGVFDRESSPEAREQNGPGSVLTADEMDDFWRNYLRDDRDADDPLACPLRADLAGLPRTLLVVPEFDLLTEQSVRLASRLSAAGVDVELELYRGATHSFLEAVSSRRSRRKRSTTRPAGCAGKSSNVAQCCHTEQTGRQSNASSVFRSSSWRSSSSLPRSTNSAAARPDTIRCRSPQSEASLSLPGCCAVSA